MGDRIDFMGLPLDALTMAETVDRVDQLIEADRAEPAQHVVLNAAKVVAAREDRELRAAIEGCDLVGADGMSIVWAARLLGLAVPERVAGIDLMTELMSYAATRGRSVYLLGAHEETVQEVARRLREHHPTLRIAGARNGYWSPEEESSVVAAVADTDADLLFVAMPSPKKEIFVTRHRHKLGVRFVMGVGGSFDVVAGRTRRAPTWMQRAGLEWLYRLLQEPGRMFRRYLVGNTRFAKLVISEVIRSGRPRSRSHRSEGRL
jgi:N-acetylglucosaminyldiphosphoundecaprenol N-acetyl-beta-D-mannosaminyltransferase